MDDKEDGRCSSRLIRFRFRTKWVKGSAGKRAKSKRNDICQTSEPPFQLLYGRSSRWIEFPTRRDYLPHLVWNCDIFFSLRLGPLRYHRNHVHVAKLSPWRLKGYDLRETSSNDDSTQTFAGECYLNNNHRECPNVTLLCYGYCFFFGSVQ